MELYLLITLCGLVVLAIILLIAFRGKKGDGGTELMSKMNELQGNLGKIESGLKEDFRINREEDSTIAKENRAELNATLKEFTLELRNKFDELKQEQKELINKTVEQLEKITVKVEEKLTALNEQSKSDNQQLRDVLVNTFKNFQETFDKNVK